MTILVRLAPALLVLLALLSLGACDEAPGASPGGTPPGEGACSDAVPPLVTYGDGSLESLEPGNGLELIARREPSLGDFWKLSPRTNVSRITILVPSGCVINYLLEDMEFVPGDDHQSIVSMGGPGGGFLHANVDLQDRQNVNFWHKAGGAGDLLVNVDGPDFTVFLGRTGPGDGDAHLTINGRYAHGIAHRLGSGTGNAVCGTGNSRLGSCAARRYGREGSGIREYLEGDGHAIVQGSAVGSAEKLGTGSGSAWCATSGYCWAEHNYLLQACTGGYRHANCPPSNPGPPEL